MTTGSSTRMTAAEVTAFAQKVEDWGRSLTPREQEFLTDLIARAASVEQPDVQGYATNLNSRKSNVDRVGPGVPPTPNSFLTLDGLTPTFMTLAGH